MASIASTVGKETVTSGRGLDRGPAEGWLIVLLHLIIILIATWSVQAAGWSDETRFLPVVALSATLFGFLLAKSPAIDLLAHLLTFWVGIAVVWIATAATYPELGTGWRSRLVAVAERARSWMEGSAQGRPADDHILFLGLLVVSIWLVAYMSAWTLYRRHWITAAVGLPSIVVLCNAGYSGKLSPWPLGGMLLAAVMLIAAHFTYRHRATWRDEEVIWPTLVRWRSTVVAAQMALLALAGAWITPENAREQVISQISGRLEQPIDQVDQWSNTLFSRFNGRSAPPEKSYSQFSDSFELGGALDLSDDPVVVLDADATSYLVAYRYDHWDGYGWDSAVERTFSGRNADGKRYSPQMRFAPGQPVALSHEVTTARAPVSGNVTLIEASGQVLLTLDTFQQADVPTTVQLSWRTLDGARLPIDDAGALPPDLRHLAILLDEANATGFETSGTSPLTGQQELDQSLLAEQNQLRDRLIAVNWQLNDAGRVDAVIVSGQLPVYDDVEAVFGRDDPSGTSYDVIGLASVANTADLRAAGQDYPVYLRDRYLQQSPTTTARTRALAAAIVQQAGANNPFDQAVAIQDDLRERIRYNEQIGTPPDDQDLVDYVLFDSKEGYCEYYASAMAVMLRTLGIPSRIAVGYYPASYDDQYAGYLYRQRNAHAWVESYFPGYGWIPFEPTASQPVRDYGDRALPQPLPASSPTPEPPLTATPDVPPTPTAPPLPVNAANGQDGNGSGGGVTTWVVRGIIGLMALALGITAVMSLLWRRGLGGLSASDAVWARVLKAGRWMGMSAEPSMTPLEYAEEIGRAVPAARGAAGEAATLYTLQRYGPMIEQTSPTRGDTRPWRELRRPLTRAWAKRRLLRRR